MQGPANITTSSHEVYVTPDKRGELTAMRIAYHRLDQYSFEMYERILLCHTQSASVVYRLERRIIIVGFQTYALNTRKAFHGYTFKYIQDHCHPSTSRARRRRDTGSAHVPATATARTRETGGLEPHLHNVGIENIIVETLSNIGHKRVPNCTIVDTW